MNGGSHARTVSWGEILWDLFPDGRQLGGAPANLAFHLAQLGGPTVLISRVGDDEPGRAALRTLAAHGIDVSAVGVDSERPTGAVQVRLEDDGSATYHLNRGGAWEHIALDARAAELVGASGALYYGTFCQRNPAAVAAQRSALRLAPADCLRVCDPNLRRTGVETDVLRWSLNAADVVKINDREAARIEELFGTVDAVAWLRDHGTRIVALTRGAGGARLVGPNGEDDHPGLEIQGGHAADTVGAGDVYTAVLIHMLLRDDPAAPDLERINRLANHAGAFVASRRGATPTLPDHIIRQVAE